MLILWSGPALADLRNIDDWLTHNASGDVSVRTLAAIRSRFTVREAFPRRGRPYRNGQRLLRVDETPYLIRYRVITQAVQVIRDHHERENRQLQA